MNTKKDLLLFAHKAEASAFVRYFQSSTITNNTPSPINASSNHWLQNFDKAVILYCRTIELQPRITAALQLMGGQLRNVYCLGTAGLLNTSSLLGVLEKNAHTHHIRHLILAEENKTQEKLTKEKLTEEKPTEKNKSTTLAATSIKTISTQKEIQQNKKIFISKKNFTGASPTATACCLTNNNDVVTTSVKTKLGFYANLADREFFFMAKALEQHGIKAFYIKTISDEANEETSKKKILANASLFSARLLKAYQQCAASLYNSSANYKKETISNKNGYQSFLQSQLTKLVTQCQKQIETQLCIKLSQVQKKIFQEKMTKNFLQFHFKKEATKNKSGKLLVHNLPTLKQLCESWERWQSKTTHEILTKLPNGLLQKNPQQLRKVLLESL